MRAYIVKRIQQLKLRDASVTCTSDRPVSPIILTMLSSAYAASPSSGIAFKCLNAQVFYELIGFRLSRLHSYADCRGPATNPQSEA